MDIGTLHYINHLNSIFLSYSGNMAQDTLSIYFLLIFLCVYLKSRLDSTVSPHQVRTRTRLTLICLYLWCLVLITEDYLFYSVIGIVGIFNISWSSSCSASISFTAEVKENWQSHWTTRIPSWVCDVLFYSCEWSWIKC